MSKAFDIAMMKGMGIAFAAKSRKMLPDPQYRKCEIREERITMPDGVRLAATLSSPDFSRKWPVVVMRYPYIMYDWMKDFYHKLFSEQGYAFALVQVRGTVRSEGEFQAMHEADDGRAVLDWIGEQSWCDGNIATIGASYCGSTQWAVADYHHPMLKTMYISVFGAESYDIFYHRGLFNKEVWTEWTAQMMGDNKHEMFSGAKGARLREKAFSVSPQVRLSAGMDAVPCDWYKDWVTNWRGDEPYWTEGYWARLKSMAEQLDIPVFLHGGYFDIFLHNMTSCYKRIPEDIRKKSVFMIGPWVHSGLASGDLKYPGEEKAGFLQVVSAIKWFDHIIKGKAYTEPKGCLEAYNIGENKWEVWPEGFTHNKELVFYLDSSSCMDKAFGAAERCPDASASIGYFYDPEDPVISRGGRLIANHNKRTGAAEASCLQDPVGVRQDVISFVTDRFDSDEKITGSVKAHLFVSSSAPATAFTIKISEIKSDGSTYNIRDDYTDIRWPDEDSGWKEYNAGDVRELTFDMVDISWRISAGSRLRIDVSSSSDPQFAPHHNTLEPWAESVSGVVARQTIYTGANYPSRVILPITEQIQTGGNR